MGVCRICQGGPTFWEACDAWRSQAFARGVRGHASPQKNFEWCNLVRFGAFFSIFFTFKKYIVIKFCNKNNSKNIIFCTNIYDIYLFYFIVMIHKRYKIVHMNIYKILLLQL